MIQQTVNATNETQPQRQSPEPLPAEASPHVDDASELLKAALSYAERGWPVFPLYEPTPDAKCTCGQSDCDKAGKHPRTPRGFKDATTDAAQIRAYWQMWPNANIGIPAGAVSGLVVLDVDDPEALEGWQADTLTADTGRGHHFYFAVSGAAPKSCKIKPGLDLRGEGAYVVAPPSRHVSGVTYSWRDPGEQLKPFPAWLLHGSPIPKGERNTRLFNMASAARAKGKEFEEILSELRFVNGARCEPPLPDNELCEIAKSVTRYQPHAAWVSAKSAPDFPRHVITGSLGELALELSKGTEVPEEFIFATSLTCLGAMVSGKLQLRVGVDSDTRLFTVLLGKSATAKKSSAMARTIEFFKGVQSPFPWSVNYGVGSAEGLAKELGQQQRLLLAYDELRSFIDKSKIQASVLLPMVASLFEKYSWDNTTKTATVSVRNARLSLIGCCTTETYEHIWTAEAIALGMPNRLFVVDADAKPKRAWPEPPDKDALDRIRKQIQQQIARLPLTFDITPEAKLLWESWYENLRTSEHAKRLDTIGCRLIPLLALTMDKEVVDVEVVEYAVALLDYELGVRLMYDPIDADDRIARLEENIRRNLNARGRLKKRQLRQQVHGDRVGIWAFEAALKNLEAAGDIALDDEGGYYLCREAIA